MVNERGGAGFGDAGLGAASRWWRDTHRLFFEYEGKLNCVGVDWLGFSGALRSG